MFNSSHVVSVDLGRQIVIGRWLMYMINAVTVMSNHPQKRSLASRSPSQGARGALGDSQALYNMHVTLHGSSSSLAHEMEIAAFAGL